MKVNKKANSYNSIFRNVLIVILCLVLIVGVCCYFFFSSLIAEVAEIDKQLESKIFNVEPTTIYDRNGIVIGEIGAESREIVTYDQIPQVTIDAFLAIEDSRYFSHNGFDLPRFISSAVNNLRSGSFSQGGSTLTMQTIDNFFIKPQEEADASNGITYSTKDKLLSKIKEIYLAMRLDSKMSKEDILINYLNKINFGNSARGIQRGAQYYFGKNVENLNLSESAFLAGVINAPYTNNPYRGYDEASGINFYEHATNRRNTTLRQMYNHGYISESEYELAKTSKLAFQLNGDNSNTANPYQPYILAALREAQELTGDDPATTPMQIYTALDTKAQDAVNKIMNKEAITMPSNEYFQVATSIIDNKTGEVVAIGTGFDDPYTSSYRDRANLEKHQPGSTVKPFLDYAMAFEKVGWATSKVVKDEKLEIYGQVKHNYDYKYYGKVSIERAIAQSLNIPAFKALMAVVDTVGYDPMKQYLSDIGFDAEVTDKFDLLFAIGGAYFRVSPTQLAGAYSMLASYGTYHEPHYVREVQYKNEDKHFNSDHTTKQVLSKAAAWMTSDLLNKAIVGEYQSYNWMSYAFAGCGYPVYGKTGTTDWGDWTAQVGGGAQDGWMVNYTNEYTIATWTGFDARVDGYTFLSQEIQNMNIPGVVNRYLLDRISKNPTRLQRPEGVSDYGGGYIRSEFLSQAAALNPETIYNFKDDLKPLQELLEKYENFNPANYTEGSYQKMLEALNAGIKLAEGGENPSVQEINQAIQAIKDAAKQLKELGSNSDYNELQNVINRAQNIIDTNKYTSKYERDLKAIMSQAQNLMNSAVSKDKINNMINELTSLIEQRSNYKKD